MLKAEGAWAKGLQRALALLDPKNAHGAFDRGAAQQAPEAAASTDPSLRSLVLAHLSIGSQTNPFYVRCAKTGDGLKYLCGLVLAAARTAPLRRPPSRW